MSKLGRTWISIFGLLNEKEIEYILSLYEAFECKSPNAKYTDAAIVVRFIVQYLRKNQKATRKQTARELGIGVDRLGGYWYRCKRGLWMSRNTNNLFSPVTVQMLEKHKKMERIDRLERELAVLRGIR